MREGKGEKGSFSYEIETPETRTGRLSQVQYPRSKAAGTEKEGNQELGKKAFRKPRWTCRAAKHQATKTLVQGLSPEAQLPAAN